MIVIRVNSRGISREFSGTGRFLQKAAKQVNRVTIVFQQLLTFLIPSNSSFKRKPRLQNKGSMQTKSALHLICHLFLVHLSRLAKTLHENFKAGKTWTETGRNVRIFCLIEKQTKFPADAKLISLFYSF